MMSTTQLLPPLSHSPHPHEEETTEHFCSHLSGMSGVRGIQFGSSRGLPPDNILTITFPFPHQRCSGKPNTATMEHGHPPCAHCCLREVPSICRSWALLFAFPRAVKGHCSQENQPEKHLYHIPLLYTTLSVALANQSTWSHQFT